MDYREKMYGDTMSVRDRLAQLPFGLIIFLMMILSLSYYYEKVAAKQQINGAIAVHSQEQK
ncbi:MAG TPA: hypothetical protein VFC63_27115 [Blastocatellia bacterium]|nr:hypothetical protein [Blastocatellia bacterium]